MQNPLPAVLVIDDDPDLLQLLTTRFTHARFQVHTARSGPEGLQVLQDEPIDLVILDITLPTIDGWQTLERIREFSNVPVMILTANGRESEKVRGLQAGADDYQLKPFGHQEIVARAQALVRRAAVRTLAPSEFSDGWLTINRTERQVTVDGHLVTLTPIEYRLLLTLVGHAPQVVPTRELLERVWHDPTGVGTSRVKFAVRRLRRKLDDPAAPESSIQSVRALGYRYQSPVRITAVRPPRKNAAS